MLKKETVLIIHFLTNYQVSTFIFACFVLPFFFSFTFLVLYRHIGEKYWKASHASYEVMNTISYLYDLS